MFSAKMSAFFSEWFSVHSLVRASEMCSCVSLTAVIVFSGLFYLFQAYFGNKPCVNEFVSILLTLRLFSPYVQITYIW